MVNIIITERIKLSMRFFFIVISFMYAQSEIIWCMTRLLRIKSFYTCMEITEIYNQLGLAPDGLEDAYFHLRS